MGKGDFSPVSSISDLWRIFNSVTHETLSGFSLEDDESLERNVFQPYDISQFKPVGPEIPNVSASFYGDERERVEKGITIEPNFFHLKPDSTENIFFTQAYTAAINQSLFDVFPLGSFANATHCDNEGVCLSALVKISDKKKGEGIDLSRTAAKNIKFDGGTVTLQRYQPKNCTAAEGENPNSSVPLASCYPNEVMLLGPVSTFTVDGRNYDRNNSKIKSFLFNAPLLEYLAKKYTSNIGIEHAGIELEHISQCRDPKKRRNPHIIPKDCDPYVRMRVKYGPFPDEATALDKYYELCFSPMDGSIPSDERNAILSLCGAFTLYSSDEWPKTARMVRYIPYLAKKEHAAEKVMLGGTLNSADPSDPFDFEHVRVAVHSRNAADKIKKECGNAGHFIRNRGNSDALEYIFTPNGNIPNAPIYFYFKTLAWLQNDIEVEFLAGRG